MDGGQVDGKAAVYVRQTFGRTVNAEQPALKQAQGCLPKHKAVRRREVYCPFEPSFAEQDAYGLLVRRKKDVVVAAQVCRILWRGVAL